MPFLHTYLVDGDDYVVDQDGNRIIVQSYEYGTTGFDWQRIASATKKPPFVRSFNIRKFDNGDTWTLTVNRQMFIGIYPSQDAALQVLKGLFIRCNASPAGAEAAMTQQLSWGSSTIDQALNNLLLNRTGENDLTYILSDISITGDAFLGLQVSDTGGGWPNNPTQITTVDGSVDPLEYFQAGGYDTIAENDYFRAVLYQMPGFSIVASSNTQLKDDLDPVGTLSLLIRNLAGDGPPEATSNGLAYVGAAYATPQWTSEDWPEDLTPTYSYAWAYQLGNGPLVPIGTSGPTLDLSLVPYGASLKCGAVGTAYINGKIVLSESPAPMVAVAVSENIPVTWVRAPSILETATPSVYNITPIRDDEYVGTEPITFTFAWTQNGDAFGTNDATQTLSAPGTYSASVTGQNSAGAATTNTINQIVIAPQAVIIDSLKFYSSVVGSGNNRMPSGIEYNPQAIPVGSPVYVFAYDLDGNTITGQDILFGDSQNVVTTLISGQPSTATPTVGDILSVDSITVTGDPVRFPVTYQWTFDGKPEFTTDTYTVLASNVGVTIGCIISVESGGTLASVAVPFGIIPAAEEAPSFVSGPTANNQNIVANSGATAVVSFAAEGSPVPSSTFVWKRGGTVITGATTDSYSPVIDDAGLELTCEVTLDNGVGSSAVSSASFGDTYLLPTVVVDSTSPALSDSPAQGEEMSVTAVAPIGFPAPTFTYEWERVIGAVVVGDNSPTYTPDASDVGNFLKVSVIANNTVGNSSPDVVVWEKEVEAAPGVQDTFTKTGNGEDEPRAQASGKWFKFETPEASWASGTTDGGLSITSNTAIIPTDSGSSAITPAALQISKIGAGIASGTKIRVQYFDPLTNAPRHPPVESTSWVLNAGAYLFTFGNDDMTLDNINDSGLWGWQDGDTVTFEIITE